MVSHSTDPNPVPLSNLLPSPYHIVYAVFLLVTSFALTFAGAFLTLDRTRQFAPTNLGGITSTKSSKAKFRLEGGVGGLLGGFVFGVHCTTLLALLIINRTSAASLGAVTFLLVYFPPSIFLSLLAARFKLIALSFLGLGGGAAFSIFITYACHPSKLARVILLAVFSIICGVVCLLPIAKVQHGMVRTSASWLGALGMIVSIALLANIPSYSDPWARLWVSWDASWGNSQEHGLTAAFICLVLLGIAVDFGLHRMLGENPDAKWDSYLANYAANLPNSHDRPGVFNPDVPFWKKLFAGAETKSNEPIIFPPDKALLSKPTMPPGPGKGLSPPPYRQGKLRNPSKKTKSYPFGGTSFQPLNKVESSDSSDSEEENRYIPRPWAKRKDTKESWDGVTLADVSSAHSKGKGKSLDGDVIYSDGESVSPSVGKKDKDRDAPGWTPEFIKRHSSGKPSESPSSPTLAKSKGAPKLSAPAKRGTETPSPPPGAVPMTPSLFKALDRVSKAQSEAYGGIVSRGHTPQATTTPATAPTGPSKPTATPKTMGVGAKIGLGSKADDGVKMPAPAGGYDWTKFWRNVEENVKEDPNSLVPTSPTNAKTGR